MHFCSNTGKLGQVTYIIRAYLYIYLLLTEFEGRTISYGPSFFLLDLWPKRKAMGKKRGSVTYSRDRENKVSKIFIISLVCV